jgi:hypothetical protein
MQAQAVLATAVFVLIVAVVAERSCLRNVLSLLKRDGKL